MTILQFTNWSKLTCFLGSNPSPPKPIFLKSASTHKHFWGRSQLGFVNFGLNLCIHHFRDQYFVGIPFILFTFFLLILPHNHNIILLVLLP